MRVLTVHSVCHSLFDAGAHLHIPFSNPLLPGPGLAGIWSGSLGIVRCPSYLTVASCIAVHRRQISRAHSFARRLAGLEDVPSSGTLSGTGEELSVPGIKGPAKALLPCEL